MDNDIMKAIAKIDQKIENLKKAKLALIDVFGGMDSEVRIDNHSSNEQHEGHKQTRVRKRLTTPKATTTRKNQIKEFLWTEGFTGRADITRRTCIPGSSVAHALKDKTTFCSRNGKWGVIGQPEDMQTKDQVASSLPGVA